MSTETLGRFTSREQAEAQLPLWRQSHGPLLIIDRPGYPGEFTYQAPGAQKPAPAPTAPPPAPPAAPVQARRPLVFLDHATDTVHGSIVDRNTHEFEPGFLPAPRVS